MTIHNVSIDDDTADEITIAVLRRSWDATVKNIAKLQAIADAGRPPQQFRYQTEELNEAYILKIGLETVLGYYTILDNCKVCNGMRGGVRGNENIIDGVVTCDYCSALRHDLVQVIDL